MDSRFQPKWEGDLLELRSDHPLGARVDGDQTHFSIFAPRANSVVVSFFRFLDQPEPEVVPLKPLADGVWEVTFPKNLHSYYYYYQIDSSSDDPPSHFAPSFHVLDPYAIATVGPAGPGIIWDQSEIAPVAKRFTVPAWQDLVISEAHIRDLIRHAPINLDDSQRLGFAGLRKWVAAEGSYLKSLGVNAIELQPIQEFGDNYDKREYHWGYMPVSYFAPDSSFAQQPELGSQIKEFQDLVGAVHDAGMAVILDVVYNHVGLPNHLLHIDKYYYFNLDDNGELLNHSGCGNDLRCDTYMGRRLIIDSLSHLVEVYDVDGFRFDLAELIGIDVLRDIEAALKKIKPSIVLIAEPWSFRGHIADQMKHTGFAFWNDGYREFVRDYLMGHGNHEGLIYFLKGSPHVTAWPAQSVNYVESHDDHCWIDRITENAHHRGDNPTRNDRRRTHLLFGLMLSSLGIPMFAAGQETLRTKRGIHNTYREGEVNAIDYQRWLAFTGTHEYFRRWVEFRLSERGGLLRLDKTPSDDYMVLCGAEQGSAAAVIYNASLERGDRRLVFAINPHHEIAWIPLENVDLARWKQLADHERFDDRGLDSARFHVADRTLELPPLTCGLWEE